MKHYEEDESEFLHHEHCETCGSSDAKAVYTNGSAYCFGCGKHYPNKGNVIMSDTEDTNDFTDTTSTLVTPEIRALTARKVNEVTCRKFGYGYYKGKQVANYYDADGNLVAQKFRSKDKSFNWIGDAKAAGLFGMQLWKPHPNKKIVVVEGEIDALSLSQLQDNKWAVVSIKSGANGAKKELKKHLEYLIGFKEVILMFDNDPVGQEAAKECLSIFPPKKALNAVLPLKDVNEMLQAGRGAEVLQAMWEAKPYKPDGIVGGQDILNRLEDEPILPSYPLPDWLTITNSKTRGLRLGSLEIFTSGTGSGKTTLIKQLQMHYYETTKFNQGIIHLEEPLTDTAKGLIGIAIKKRIHLDDSVTKEEKMAKAAELFKSEDEEGQLRFQLYDAFGSVEEEDLYNKIRFFVSGLGCKIIWLDHLSILVSDLGQDGDERRKIDNIMHKLKSLTVELGCYIGLIVHLNNATTGKTFEEGAVPHLNNLRGSGGIKQLSDAVYAFSRNQQAESSIERNTSLITVLKCRYTGDTGPADFVYYDKDTGCMVKGEDPKHIEEAGEDFGAVTTDF